MSKRNTLDEIKNTLFPTLLHSISYLKVINGRTEWCNLRGMYPAQEVISTLERMSKKNKWVMRSRFKDNTTNLYWNGSPLPKDITEEELLAIKRE